MTAALVLIDLQVRVVAQPWRPRSGADVVDACVRLARTARAAGAPVVAVQSWRLRPNGDRDPLDGDELVPDVAALATDVATKHSWGAFGGTPLDQVLRRRGATGVVLAGLATNFGVESTARGADDLGYHVGVVEDATASLTDNAHAFAFELVFARLGAVLDETEATKRLAQPRRRS